MGLRHKEWVAVQLAKQRDAANLLPPRRSMRWPGALFGVAALIISTVICLPEAPESGEQADRGERFRRYLVHGQYPSHRLQRQPNLPRSAFAFFEFAPATGAGMGTACACTTPTGAKGEAMTFTRASSGTCLKGNTTTGVANGDMVTCSTNQPRVMPGGDGTGALGLLVEAARTNQSTRSEEVNNAAWSDIATGAAAPTLNGADATTSPLNTVSAEDYTFPAISSGQASGRFGSFDAVCASTMCTVSIWVKGVSGSGTIDVCLQSGGIECADCNYNNSTWTRCSYSSATITGTPFLSVGNIGNASIPGNHARASNRVYVWGAQRELGAYATSYIATTSASMTRAVDLAKFSIAPPVATSGSAAGSVIPEWSTSNGPIDSALFAAYTAGSGQFLFLEKNGGNRIYVYDGTSSTATTGDFTAGTSARLWANWSGATKTINNTTAGTSSSGAFNGAMPAADLGIGTNLGGLFPLDGVAKQICLDPSPSRCR